MGKIADVVKPGVVTGSDLQFIFKVAQENNFAIPAVNVVGSSSVNAVMEAAKNANAPVMIQFSNGGAIFNAGKGLKMEGQQAAILGAVAGAKHIHTLAEAYGVRVILHTDHAAKKLLPWIDGLLDASENISPKPENHCTAPTCSISRKSQSKKISKSAKNTWNA
jgi:fructose-bisphosphate aldolase, class II